MKWLIIALAALLAISPAAAAENITAANVRDRLILEKTKAENLVLNSSHAVRGPEATRRAPAAGAC